MSGVRLALKSIAVGLAIPLVLAASSQSRAEEVVLRMVSAFPGPLPINQPVRTFIEAVGQRGEGVLRVSFLGGPEVTPPPDQPQALRNGIIDILYFPVNYALGIVPEGDALVGSNRTAQQVRENGGWEMLQQIYAEKMNTYLLSWPGTNYRFHIFTTKQPELGEDGLPDLSGLRIRSVPIYREVLSEFGATPVSIHIPEVYTALERGIIDGAAFPVHGIRPVSWHQLVKFRIDPGFFNGDGVIAINLDKWNSLSDEARSLLEEIAVGHERESAEFFEQIVESESEKLREAGIEAISVPTEARQRYLETSYGVAWNRLSAHNAETATALRSKFYQD